MVGGNCIDFRGQLGHSVCFKFREGTGPTDEGLSERGVVVDSNAGCKPGSEA